MPENTKQTTALFPDDDSYMRFLESLQLVGLGLKSSSATIDRAVFFDLMKKKVVRRLSEVYEPTTIGEGFFEAEGRYEVTIAEDDKTGLKVQCVFEVHMHGHPPIEERMVQRFAKSDLRFVLLPYARQFVANITSQMDVPAVILPLAAAKGKARPAPRARARKTAKGD